MPARRTSIFQHTRRPGEVLLFVRIACFAALVPALLRLQLPTVARILQPSLVDAPRDPDQLQRIVNLTDLAIASCRPVVRRSCLVRTTTLYYFLTRAGSDVGLCFGVGQVNDSFAAHCWLVNDGKPYLEQQDPRPFFSTIFEIPPAGTQQPSVPVSSQAAK